MSSFCGHPVHPASTTCVLFGEFSDQPKAGQFLLGTIPYLSDLLYKFCTHLLHTLKANFTPFILKFYSLSTPPTITITTNI